MARANWKKISDLVVASEGGYTKDRRDPGNWTGGKVGKGELKGTKYGIAANTYGHLDIANLTRPQAVALYKSDYWDVANLDKVPAGLDYCVFDFNLNSGVDRSVRVLQRVLGVKEDGTLGGGTRNAIDNWPHGMEVLIDRYLDARLAYMKKLTNWGVHGKGWTTRVNKVRRISKQMCAGDKVTEKMSESSNRSDKALVENTAVSSALVSDPTNTATTGSGLAAAGATVSEFAEQVEPISYYADWAQKIFIGLLALGMVITIILMVKKKREGK